MFTKIKLNNCNLKNLLENGSFVKLIKPNPYFGRRGKILDYEGSQIYRVRIIITDETSITRRIHRFEMVVDKAVE